MKPCLVAGPGFEPGMLLAYETGVVAALPAIIWWTLKESNLLPPPHLLMATGLQPAMGNKIHNTLLRKCLLKQTITLCVLF